MKTNNATNSKKLKPNIFFQKNPLRVMKYVTTLIFNFMKIIYLQVSFFIPQIGLEYKIKYVVFISGSFLSYLHITISPYRLLYSSHDYIYIYNSSGNIYARNMKLFQNHETKST